MECYMPDGFLKKAAHVDHETSGPISSFAVFQLNFALSSAAFGGNIEEMFEKMVFRRCHVALFLIAKRQMFKCL